MLLKVHPQKFPATHNYINIISGYTHNTFLITFLTISYSQLSVQWPNTVEWNQSVMWIQYTWLQCLYVPYLHSYHSKVYQNPLGLVCRGAWSGAGSLRQLEGDSHLYHAHQKCHRCHRRDVEGEAPLPYRPRHHHHSYIHKEIIQQY